MSDCCDHKVDELTALRAQQSSTLKIVLVINALMFFVEISAGLLAHSLALVADSLDMLGDALLYGVSLYVLASSVQTKARVALLKGAVMGALGVFVLGQAIYRMVYPQLPVFETMGIIAMLALLANSLGFYLLWRHRSDDLNMKSVWLCTRNDSLANVAVLLAGVGVWITQSGWPDVAVGLALAVLVLHSAQQVIREAMAQLHSSNTRLGD